MGDLKATCDKKYDHIFSIEIHFVLTNDSLFNSLTILQVLAGQTSSNLCPQIQNQTSSRWSTKTILDDPHHQKT